MILRRRRQRRGYALVLVLMVLTLMAIALGSMTWVLETSIAEGRRTVATIRVEDACDSVLDVAGRTLQARLATQPGSDPADLLAAICLLGTCTTAGTERVPGFLAPPGTTLLHLAVAYGTPLRKTARKIPAGPFAGRVAVEQALVVNAVVIDDLTQRSCSVTDRYIVPGLPLLSFPMFGSAPRTRWSPPLSVRREKDGAPSRIHLNGNAAGTQISTSDFSLPGPQFGTEPLPVDLVNSTRGDAQVLQPAVQAPSPTSTQAALVTSFRWLVEPPNSSDSTALRAARLAEKADIVIVDGVWYDHRVKSEPWPGKPMWSDRPGSAVDHVAPNNSVVAATDHVGLGDLGFAAGTFPSLYSWYDRATADGAIRAQSEGVLSYGPLAVRSLGTSCSVDADCTRTLSNGDVVPFGECMPTPTGARECSFVEPGSWFAPDLGCATTMGTFASVTTCATAANRAAAVVDGARSGFRDGTHNVLPVNLNLRMLGEALLSSTVNELGHTFGVPLLGPGRFNGVLFITAGQETDFDDEHGEADDDEEVSTAASSIGPASLCARASGDSTTSFERCPGNASNSTHRPRARQHVPVGLCGASGIALTGSGSSQFASQPCNTAERPNAVRVYDAARLLASTFPNGLTIATDLPLYVYGDVNRVQSTTNPDGTIAVLPQEKVAFVADRVTFLSRNWRDEQHPWNDDAGTNVPSPMIVEASFVTGMPLHGSDTHDVGDAFRTLEDYSSSANTFVMRGHIAMPFASEYYKASGTTVGRGLRWLPDYHLDNPGFQPPGLPLVNLPPTGQWRQR